MGNIHVKLFGPVVQEKLLKKNLFLAPPLVAILSGGAEPFVQFW